MPAIEFLEDSSTKEDIINTINEIIYNVDIINDYLDDDDDS